MSASSAEQKLTQIKALCQKANLSQVVPSVFTAQMLIEILEEIQDLSTVSCEEDKQKSSNLIKVKNLPTILHSDLLVLGKKLGYDWNAIDSAIKEEEFYPEDGAGSMCISRNPEDECTSNKMLKHIIAVIFEEHPDLDVIYIVTD
jgi:hypothetical protein